MIASYKPFLCAVIVLLIFFCRTACAADSAYTIERIQVDVTAENAAAAREEAFALAQVRAFDALADRLLSEDERAGFERPDTEIISSLVQDFEILEEQLSHVRYIGTYRFRFREKAVSDFFSNRGVAHTDVSSRPVLVIPFYQTGQRNILWSGDNPWLRAWQNSSERRGLVPVVVPIGDLQDITDVNEDKALASDWSRTGNMGSRYGAGEVMILLAVPEYDQAGNILKLRVDVYTIEDGLPEYASSLDVSRRSGETADGLFLRATSTVKDKLQKLWKNMTIVDPSQTSEITVRVRFNDIREWIAVKSALDGVKMLDELSVESLNPHEAYLHIKFRGDEGRLRLALSQKELQLSRPRISFDQTNRHSHGLKSPLVYDILLSKDR